MTKREYKDVERYYLTKYGDEVGRQKFMEYMKGKHKKSTINKRSSPIQFVWIRKHSHKRNFVYI